MRKESHCHYPIAFVDTWYCLIAPGNSSALVFTCKYLYRMHHLPLAVVCQERQGSARPYRSL